VTDEELVFAVQSGDTHSLGVLVGRWERPLYRFVYRMLPRQEDARDICQETFLRVLKKAHRFRQGSRFSTWLYQIALNLCRDQMRRRRRWRRVLDEGREIDDRVDQLPHGDSLGEDPSRSIEQREMNDEVIRALRKIPAEQREVLILKEYEGLKFKEIAEILDCPESTVKSRMYYGLSGMRTALVRRGITGN
jgi:RNA polymerase sigma-70 factor (ECF subfamily)